MPDTMSDTFDTAKKAAPPKAIFFDVDGTLVSPATGRIPDSAKQALAYAREKGVLLFIATGRHKKMLETNSPLQDPNFNFKFDGYVTLNGQYCYSGNRVIYKNPIHPEDIRLALDCLDRRPFPCMFCEAEDQYINMIDRQTEEIFTTLHSPLPVIQEPARALGREIYQLCVFGEEQEEQKDSFLRKLRHSSYTKWFSGGWDVTPQEGNKWEGISHVLEHFNLQPHEAAAIGDSDNDAEMLTHAGYSVAMGNASDDIKRRAGYVTSRVDDEGILRAVKHLIPS